MTKQEKQILANDLCSRLRFGIKAKTVVERPYISKGSDIKIRTYEYDLDDTLWINGTYEIDDIKPYLRPLGSMTEEEKRELSKKYVWDINCGQIEIRYHSDGYWDDNIECPTSEYLNLFDWLNAHHFDYRGLIPKGLANEAPDGMYNLLYVDNQPE